MVKQTHKIFPSGVFGTIWPYPIVVATEPIKRKVLSNVQSPLKILLVSV